jgi:hypothetical protein
MFALAFRETQRERESERGYSLHSLLFLKREHGAQACPKLSHTRKVFTGPIYFAGVDICCEIKLHFVLKGLGQNPKFS